MIGKTRSYAAASAPDIVARLNQAIEANQTTRVLVDEGVRTLTEAIKLHLDQTDQHLRDLIADIEGRVKDGA